jgi:glycosyltransferase involved in cell wall biosynthesis
MDTTFFAIFSRYNDSEIIYYAEAPENFKETGAMKKTPLKNKNKFLRLIEKIIFMRKLEPDYLFGHGTVLEIPYILFKPRKTKYIINFHSILVKKGNSDWSVRTPWFLRKFLFEKADFIVAISEFAKKTITDFFPNKDVKMIYSGAELKFFTPEKENKPALREKFNINFDAPLVVFVGTLQPRKRPNVFIEVAKRCKEANFVMVGREDGVHNYLKEAKNLKNFQHIPVMEREEVAQFFASADIFLFPSVQETFGAVVVEAIASGTPVIVSRSGAFPELVRDNFDGFIVPVDSNEIDIFVSDIRKILEDKNLRNFFSDNAVRDAKKFSWQKTSDNYKKILLSNLK